MNNTEFLELLAQLKACEEAVAWVGSRDLATAWRECERADWMLWLAARLNVSRQQIVLAACACAETALKYVYEGEDRPRLAIEAARKWALGPIVSSAAAAAAAKEAAWAASWAAAAAREAAWAATRAAEACSAAEAAAEACSAAAAARGAAWAASWSASWAAEACSAEAAKEAAHRIMAVLVRKEIPFIAEDGVIIYRPDGVPLPHPLEHNSAARKNMHREIEAQIKTAAPDKMIALVEGAMEADAMIQDRKRGKGPCS